MSDGGRDGASDGVQEAGFGALALVATALAGGCGNSASGVQRSADPPLLVPWNRVGNISLGQPRARVEREYGSPGHGYHVIVPITNGLQGYYVLHGGEIGVRFEDGRVEEISFGVRYYRTKNGFGVGSRIPLGPCVRTWTHRCGHRWHGFVWNEYYREDPCGCWVKVGLGKRSLPPTLHNFLGPWFFIYVQHGRVEGFRFATKFVD